jgi:hypothetical protein
MSFLGWTFLFGVAAIAGPMLAHLLAKPRFRRLPFTMLQFLRSSQAESYSRRRLRDLLILLLRCAIIVLIALLFARPILYLKPKPKDSRHIYYLGLDNSVSMTYIDSTGSYFYRMKDSVIEHIVSAETDAVFNIFALASGNWIQNVSRQQALAEVKALKITTGSADVVAFLSGVNSSGKAVSTDDDVSVLIVSDFTPQILKQFLNVREPAFVDNLKYETIVSLNPINNASIIFAQTVEAAPDNFTINVSVANHGQTRQSRQLTAKVGSDESVSLDVELLPNQVKAFPVKIETGFGKDQQLFFPVELSLSPGDNLKADDTYYLVSRLSQTRHINILLVEANKDQMFLLDTAMQTLSGRSSDKIIRIRRILIDDLNAESLDWANVCIFSGINEGLGRMVTAVSDFVEAGGKAAFFLTGKPDTGAMSRLWQLGVLPALPEQFKQEQTCPEIRPGEKQLWQPHPVGMGMAENNAVKAMTNYRIDQIPVTGFWECKQHEQSKCLWQYQNGPGFIYSKQIGGGESILINTSADDSLGSLTKSSVSVAFCQFLLGQNNQVRDYSFTCDERIVLPAMDIKLDSNRQKTLWVRCCDGSKKQAALTDPFISLVNPGGIGWIKTLTDPELCAGVNLPSVETDMSKPTAEEVNDALKRIFSIGARKNAAMADSYNTGQQKPIWQILVWIIIALLLVESALANRLRR